ncbi:Mrna Decay Activator Protein Zfp36L1 [Manis pentadactyla]|nr:Mrna Decay Activator Protein Zfp36L1 [Manis pentadactyla]
MGFPATVQRLLVGPGVVPSGGHTTFSDGDQDQSLLGTDLGLLGAGTFPRSLLRPAVWSPALRGLWIRRGSLRGGLGDLQAHTQCERHLLEERSLQQEYLCS